MTGLPRLFELTSWTRATVEGKAMYQLNLESIDLIDRPLTKGVVAGRVQTTIFIKAGKGTVRIDSLDAYPVRFHRDEKNLMESITNRGKKWVGLIGLHHMQYDGIAALRCGDKVLRHHVRSIPYFLLALLLHNDFQVNSRIMVDRSTFRKLNPNYQFSTPVPPKVEENPFPQNNRFIAQNPVYDVYGNPVPVPIAGQNGKVNMITSHNTRPTRNVVDTLVQTVSPDDTAESLELNEDELLLTSPVVYGFSMIDKACVSTYLLIHVQFQS
jgi:hypothetical protein